MSKSFNFILSGIISFSFYILICFLFVYYVYQPKVKKYTVNKTTTIQLDMIVEKSDKKRIEKKADKKIEKPVLKPIKKETSKAIEKKPDLKSLFGKVKIKEKKLAKKEVNNVQKSLDPKRFKAKYERQKKSSNIKIDKLFNDKKTTSRSKNIKGDKNKESNEYFSKINELLYEWKAPREANLKAIVTITIKANGKFSYKFIKLSGNTNFDLSLKAFLEEQKSIIYPKPQKGKRVRIKVDFKSEG